MTKLLINEPPLQVLPTLACAIGLNEALILQQVHYWLDPRLNKNLIEGRLWVHNSLKQWLEQFPFFSERTLQRALHSLENAKLLGVGYFNKNAYDRTKWYTINYEILAEIEKEAENPYSRPRCQNGVMHDVKMAPCKAPKWQDASCQNGVIDDAILASSYKDAETTSENTSEKGSPLSPCEEVGMGNVRTSDPRCAVSHPGVSLGKSALEVPLDPGVVPSSAGQPGLANEAFEIWHERVGCKTTLRPERVVRLEHLLKERFRNDLVAWKALCDGVVKTPFLMGQNARKWRITLEWILDPQNCQKVLEGAYQATDTTPDVVAETELTALDAAQVADAFIQSSTDIRLKRFVSVVRRLLGDDTFAGWHHGLVLGHSDDFTLTITGTNRFQLNHIRQTYGRVYEAAAEDAGFAQVVIQDAKRLDPPSSDPEGPDPRGQDPQYHGSTQRNNPNGSYGEGGHHA